MGRVIVEILSSYWATLAGVSLILVVAYWQTRERRDNGAQLGSDGRPSDAAVELLEATTERGEIWVSNLRLLERPAVCIPDGQRGRIFIDGCAWFASVDEHDSAYVRAAYLEAVDELLFHSLIREDTNSSSRPGRRFSLTTAGLTLVRSLAQQEQERITSGSRVLSPMEVRILQEIRIFGSHRRWLLVVHSAIELAPEHANDYAQVTLDRFTRAVVMESDSIPIGAEAVAILIKGVPTNYVATQTIWVANTSGHIERAFGVRLTESGFRYLRNLAFLR